MKGEGCSWRPGDAAGRAGTEAELTCLAQSSLLRLSPSCSSFRSWLTLSSSFCSCRPCQTQTSLTFPRAGILFFPTHPPGGLAAPPERKDGEIHFTSPHLCCYLVRFCLLLCIVTLIVDPQDLESALNLSDPAPKLFLIGE